MSGFPNRVAAIHLPRVGRHPPALRALQAYAAGVDLLSTAYFLCEAMIALTPVMEPLGGQLNFTGQLETGDGHE